MTPLIGTTCSWLHPAGIDSVTVCVPGVMLLSCKFPVLSLVPAGIPSTLKENCGTVESWPPVGLNACFVIVMQPFCGTHCTCVWNDDELLAVFVSCVEVVMVAVFTSGPHAVCADDWKVRLRDVCCPFVRLPSVQITLFPCNVQRLSDDPAMYVRPDGIGSVTTTFCAVPG